MIKTQVIIEQESLEIIDVQEGKGSEHDFKIYKETIGDMVSNSIVIYADLGYQGIAEYHPNSLIPIKSSKKHPLTKEERRYNKEVARRRVVIEHVNCKIKVFKSMSNQYRGHCCNRHSLRMKLICGIINYDRVA
jgi:hypothetical protein